MLGISGGIEPIYNISYNRKTESLHGEDKYYKVYTPIVKDYMNIKNIESEEDLSDIFVTAMTLDYKDRINIQSIWQTYIDASISSTVNVNNEFTIEEVEQLYLYAWKKGLKGVTIYRDGCRRSGVLSTETKKEDKPKENISNTKTKLDIGDILSVNDDLLSAKRTVINGCGKFYIHTDFDEHTGEQLETFIEIGSGGGCERNLQFISRLISLLLRSGVPVETIIDQAMSIRPCKAYTDRTKAKGDTSKGTSCPSAIGHALIDLKSKIEDRFMEEVDDYYNDFEIEQVEFDGCSGNCDTCSSHSHVVDTCPECGEEVISEGGCNVCKSCGYSKCS